MPIFKKNVFPVGIFVSASLSAIILLPIFLIFFKAAFLDNIRANQPLVLENAPIFNTDDPYITTVKRPQDSIKQPVINQADPILGSPKAPVAIVEYSDYSCKFCQKQESVLRQIVQDYKNKVRLIWKDYPENNSYSPAWLPAIAARCALAQDKFWEYHDILFQGGAATAREKFLALAGRLKMDKNKFSACLDGVDVRNQIRDNILEANALNISGVPFIYVNGLEVMGEVSYDDLKKMVEGEINKKN